MNVVAICSGGLDSTILYHYLKQQGNLVTVLNFDYGSKHNDRERAALNKLIPNVQTLNLDLTLFKSALLKHSSEAIPEGHYADSTMKSTVVPFRNGIMLSYAVGYADSYEMDCVALGNHFGDHAVYPDCRAEFVEMFGLAAQAGTYSNIQFLAPFTEMTKTEIVKFAIRELKLTPEYLAGTWSCYVGGEHHCGRCSTCVERKEAFADAGVEDKTIYLN